MLTSDLVRVRVHKDRVVPTYLHRDDPDWLEIAESLLVIFREGVGRTRSELENDVESLIGHDPRTLTHRGIAKVLEDRAQFDVVAAIEPETLRARAFELAATQRHEMADRKRGAREVDRKSIRFNPEIVLQTVAAEFNIEPHLVPATLFADLRGENRMQSFDDVSAQRLIDAYNVALVQAVLLKSMRMTVEIRADTPARYRQLFRWLKFHRLLVRATGDPDAGYTLTIDGPLSLHAATTKYGVQIANFLPHLLHCTNFRLEAELLWGPKRLPMRFQLATRDSLVADRVETGTYVPPEFTAFLDRLRQIAPDWEVRNDPDIQQLGTEGFWVPDARFIHRQSQVEVHVEWLGFWGKSTLERLVRLLPQFGPPNWLLLVSERMKVDEDQIAETNHSIVRFKDIPNATEVANRLKAILPSTPPAGPFKLR